MKGLVVEKKFGSYIVLTPSGEYKRVHGATKADVGQEIQISSNPSTVRIASLAAAILIIFLLSDIIFGITMNTRVYAYVTLDINPSAEFAINSEHEVLNAYPYNHEAQAILSGINYSGMNIEKVLADFTLAAIDNHFIEDGKENRVIVSFYPRQGLEEASVKNELERITDEQRKILDSSGKQFEMDTVIIDEETRIEAKKQGITPGKLKENKNQLNDGNGSSNNSEKKAEKEVQKEAEKALKEERKENKKEDKKQEKLQEKINKDAVKLNKEADKLKKVHEKLEEKLQKQQEKQKKDELKLNQKQDKLQKGQNRNKNKKTNIKPTGRIS